MSQQEFTQERAVSESRRVRALLMKVSAPHPGSKRAALMKLLAWQPVVRRVRFEGLCPACKRKGGFMSYILPQRPLRLREQDGEQYENCGYYCAKCQFANAGARPVT